MRIVITIDTDDHPALQDDALGPGGFRRIGRVLGDCRRLLYTDPILLLDENGNKIATATIEED